MASFRKIHVLEILEHLEILEFLVKPQTCGKQNRFRPFSKASRDFRDFRDDRDLSNANTPFVMTPFARPEKWEFHREGGNRALVIALVKAIFQAPKCL